ncbi:ABC transporter ATP-binding protein [Enterococcus faecium]|uniref:ABC transporter ATP-binding protein n=1 Tax=Enterococcus faecium TaxID=1352 RepID=UPI000F5067F6|nr:ABC transporter ATP-binding protein [Enterococcus faecium]EME7181814.1 ABC transporter ATP-binding protein [Enterococcus faecium]ROX57599.1 ABC transporter ATP-binding protein [Enterococcus faecium]
MKAIEFKEVEKSFQDGDQVVKALKETTMSIDKGEFVAIIGPSGSGKSTFLTLAGGLQTPSSGSVFINDQEFSNQKESERVKLRFKEIGFILQASNLVPFLTVKKQLLLVDKIKHERRQKEAKELFEQLGVDKLINKYPEELSGGERQRVAIARALYNDPSIILADEPTASLDSEKAREVVDILAKESKEKNKATIMVTHDTRLIDKCDRIFMMEDGILKEKE